LVGGVVGLTGGLAATGAGAVLGGGVAATVAAGAFAGAVGATAGQITGWGFDRLNGSDKSLQESFSVRDVALGAVTGGVGAGLGRAVGRAFGMPAPGQALPCNPTMTQLGREFAFHGTVGAASGMLGDALAQGVGLLTGEQKSWEWGRFFGAGAQGAITGIATHAGTCSISGKRSIATRPTATSPSTTTSASAR
jgi:hypothetical protein